MKNILFSAFILLFMVNCTTTNPKQDILNPKEIKSKLPAYFASQWDSIWTQMDEESQSWMLKSYSLMSLQDKLDYPPAFHWSQIRATLKAKKELPWSAKVSDQLFNYYVAPLRVNNENLDTSRSFFYSQLKNRVQNMSMLDAAMEVNHWCHEHVTYQGSDTRTSSALTTYRNGYGRCGEESVFVVSALRSIGIPARQVYTPRWAHTDDNHAWVEFWADGKWYYYGATEPAALPNQGWFTEPARRAMLVSTRISGPYEGKERVITKTPNYTIINSLAVYAPIKEVFVKVVDESGNPISDADVQFQLYNYAEFYSLAQKKTNQDGLCNMLSGFGDLYVWVNKGKLWNAAECDLRETDTLTIQLPPKQMHPLVFDWEYNPPVEPEPMHIPDGDKAANKIRTDYEDSLRRAYDKTFPDSAKIQLWANQWGLDFTQLKPIIQKSRGNWQHIYNFLNISTSINGVKALDLLESLNEKDLHDIVPSILMDHFTHTQDFSSSTNMDKEVWKKWVLCPRVEYEMIQDYRAYLQDFGKENNLKTAQEIFEYLKQNLKMDTTNFAHLPISAKASLETGLSDGVSRDLIFVEFCRSLNIPARLDQGSLKPQYLEGKDWISMDFYAKTDQTVDKNCALNFEYQDSSLQYYKHFTLAKFANGKYYTLEFPWDKKISSFEQPLMLEAGKYRLTTGNRLLDGSVLCHFEYFELETKKPKSIHVFQRQQNQSWKVVTTIDPEWNVINAKKQACTLMPKKEKIVIWINPLEEPSKHILEDIAKKKEEFLQKGIEIEILTSDQLENYHYDSRYFDPYFQWASFSIDSGFKNLKLLSEKMNINYLQHLPVVTIIKGNGDVSFLKSGYTIGIEDALLSDTQYKN